MKTQEIADLLSAELVGDPNVEVVDIASLSDAESGQLAFAESSTQELVTRAACVLVRTDFSGKSSTPVIKVSDPKLAFAVIASKLRPRDARAFRHETAFVSPTANVQALFLGAYSSIGERTNVLSGCEIHDGVRIGKNVSIGENTIVRPNCVIYDDSQIGANCELHAGVVIGAPGFGYVRDGSGEYHQFPQIGKVVIEDNVEIGANSCVDRGALGETRIGEGTKIDNLVQIAHNVQIGKRVVIAAQTGISGSTVIEDDCVIGGQVGMGDHARVQSGAVIGSQAGVLPGKIVRPGVWWGTPVQLLDEYKRQNAHVKGIERLKKIVLELKEDVVKLKRGEQDSSGSS